MRRTIAALSIALLAGCASMPIDDPSDWQALSAEAIDGVDPDDIRIEGLHGFMLNVHWTAVTPKGRYGCLRDPTGTPTCTKRG